MNTTRRTGVVLSGLYGAGRRTDREEGRRRGERSEKGNKPGWAPWGAWGGLARDCLRWRAIGRGDRRVGATRVMHTHLRWARSEMAWWWIRFTPRQTAAAAVPAPQCAERRPSHRAPGPGHGRGPISKIGATCVGRSRVCIQPGAHDVRYGGCSFCCSCQCCVQMGGSCARRRVGGVLTGFMGGRKKAGK